MALPRFYISNLALTSIVYLEGEETPTPWPYPYKASRGSDHTTLAGESAPGTTLRQDFGADRYGILEFSVKRLLPASRTALLEFYEAWEDGERPQVLVGYAGSAPWTCTWVDLKIVRRSRREEIYAIENCVLRIGPDAI